MSVCGTVSTGSIEIGKTPGKKELHRALAKLAIRSVRPGTFYRQAVRHSLVPRPFPDGVCIRNCPGVIMNGTGALI